MHTGEPSQSDRFVAPWVFHIQPQFRISRGVARQVRVFVPLVQVLNRPVDRLVEVSQVAGVRLVGLNHGAICWAENPMRADHVLHSFVDSRHVAIHTAGPTTAVGVVRVRDTRLGRTEFLMTLNALRVVLLRRVGPARTDRPVWFAPTLPSRYAR